MRGSARMTYSACSSTIGTKSYRQSQMMQVNGRMGLWPRPRGTTD